MEWVSASYGKKISYVRVRPDQERVVTRTWPEKGWNQARSREPYNFRSRFISTAWSKTREWYKARVQPTGRPQVSGQGLSRANLRHSYLSIFFFVFINLFFLINFDQSSDDSTKKLILNLNATVKLPSKIPH